MSKNTVIDECLGEITYHITLRTDGEKYKVVDFDRLPHPSPDGYRFSLYRSGSFILSANDLPTAREYIYRKKELHRLEKESVRVADPE